MKKVMPKFLIAMASTMLLMSCQDTTKNTDTAVLETEEIAVLSKAEKNETISKGYTIGDVAAPINLKDVDGDMVSYEDYPDAKGFIVIFTCNTCPFAVASEDRIIALDKKYKSKGYPVIAINPNDPAVQPDDTYELMQKKAKEKSFTFPYLYDSSNSVYATYGATKTPHVYLLHKEKKGNVVKYIGAIDDNVRNGAEVNEQFLATAIDELLAGKEVTLKETKAIGCSVKQKKA